MCIYSQLQGGGGGWQRPSILPFFRLSMIAPVKKSVNHSRTVASMRETGCEQQQQVRFRSDSTVRSEFRITINEVPYELFTSRLLMSKRSIKKGHRNLFLMFRRRKTENRPKTHRSSKSAFSAIFVLKENLYCLTRPNHVNSVPDLAASPPPRSTMHRV